MKNNNSSLINNRKFLIIFSVVASFALWLFVSMVISPDSTVVIRGVPVNINISNTAVEKLGLNLFDGADQTIDVTVSGKRYVISQIKKEDFTVDVSLSSVVAPGEYNLVVTPVYNGTRSGVSITDPINKTLLFTFDYRTSKAFEIEPDISKIEFQSDYTAGLPELEKSDITIEGPSSEIDLIDKVVAVAPKTNNLSGTAQLSSEIVLYDKGGNIYTSKNLVLEFDKVNITIPMVGTKTISSILVFENAPKYFESTPLSYTIEPSELKLVGVSEILDTIKDIEIGTVNFENLSPSKNKFSYDVTLPGGVTTDEGESEIKFEATVDLGDYKEVKAIVSNIRTVNMPEGAAIKVVTDKISDVRLIVPKNVNNLNEKNLFATIDIDGKEYKAGKYTLNVEISSSTIDRCWAVGKYSAVIEVS